MTFALTQLIFYGTCWLSWDGRQAVRFSFEEGKFYLFKLVLWPQDGLYLAMLLILSALALFAVTAVLGRLFCGFACPQTTYTALFMAIEEWSEGKRSARIKLDDSAWNTRKLFLRGRKHVLWLLLALWTGLSFVGYFVPVRTLVPEFLNGTAGPWSVFWTLFYAGFTYLMAGFLREKVCQHMCPYSRFQGVMFDASTVTVGYDQSRGEPRGALHVKQTLPVGDCVSCTLCEQVCPAGIDIRQGLQYECISCGLCVDACNAVMDKIGRARGLIRFDSLDRFREGHRQALKILRPRVLIYSCLLLLISVSTLVALYQRTPLQVDVMRDRNMLAREIDDGSIENIFHLRLTNMQTEASEFRVEVSGIPEAVIIGTHRIRLEGLQETSLILVVRASPDPLRGRAQPMEFVVWSPNSPQPVRVVEKSKFLLPM